MPAAADEIPLSSTPIPDHHLSKKRKIKSSSKRRRRPRPRSSSPSSDDGASRRKRSKKRKRSPSPKRRKDTKKKKSNIKNKKKSRRRKPRRDDTSSDSSCSTCRSSSPGDGLRSRSLSPVRKVKPKVRGRSSGRERTRKNLHRSPSCSTCGSHSSHSCSQSPHRERSKERERRPKHPKTEFLDDDRDKISISARSSDFLRASQSSEDEGYGVGRWGEADDAAYTGNVNEMEQVVLSKVNVAVDYSCQENFRSTKDASSRMTSVVVVDSLPAGDSDDICDDPRGCEPKSSGDLSNTMVVAAGSNSLGGEDLEMILRQQALERFLKKRGGVTASSRTLGDGKDKTTSKDAEGSVDAGSGSTKGLVKSVKYKTASSLGSHTHALGGGHPVTVGSKFVSKPVVCGSGDNVPSKLAAADHKISSSSNNQNAQNRVCSAHESSINLSPEQPSLTRGPVKSVECKPPGSLDDHMQTQEGNRPIKVGAKSVPNPVASGLGGNVTSKSADERKISSSINNWSTQNHIKSVHESPNKMSLEQSSLPEDIQGKRVVAEPNGNTQGPEANLVDRSASGTSCLKTETGNCKSNEAVVEAGTGSQFEQKTFSRMRDGEVVQVSYKVYIPKKRPAIARRQLQ